MRLRAFRRQTGCASASILLVFCMSASCGGKADAGQQVKSAPADPMRFTSPAFQNGGSIPQEYTCEGRNISPLLEWSTPPRGTESLALIVDDPDAPGKTWVHWVAYNLPASSLRLPKGVPNGAKISGGGRQGRNDFGNLGYGGPCPPPGKAHHYHFKLYALSQTLPLQPGATKEDVIEAARGHVLSTVELIGAFRR